MLVLYVPFSALTVGWQVERTSDSEGKPFPPNGTGYLRIDGGEGGKGELIHLKNRT